MLRKLLSVFVLCVCSMAAFGQGQELLCKVTILHDKITGVDATVFTNMQRAITEFMNNKKWTGDEYTVSERIEVNIMMNITANKVGGDDNAYTATLNIQATRPVYNTGYNSPIVNFVDRDVAFRYSAFVPLQFEDNRVTGTDPLASNLTAILAYYAYIILGLDYDSYASMAGTPYFKKAQNIVTQAPESSKAISGWKAVEGTHNRYWIAEQLLNNRFEEIRKFWYTYHREGLDNMYSKPAESRLKILSGIPKMAEINKENPRSVLIQFFFNAKSDEIVKMLAQLPVAERAPYLPPLQQMDVSNVAKYNNLSK